MKTFTGHFRALAEGLEVVGQRTEFPQWEYLVLGKAGICRHSCDDISSWTTDMRKRFVIPYILREDFDNFRLDVGLPSHTTYEEWSRTFAHQVEEARRHGKTVVLASVIYDHFREDCRTKGLKPNHKTLIAFAEVNKPAVQA